MHSENFIHFIFYIFMQGKSVVALFSCFQNLVWLSPGSLALVCMYVSQCIFNFHIKRGLSVKLQCNYVLSTAFWINKIVYWSIYLFLQRYSLVLLVVLYIIYKLSAVNFLNILRQKQISIRVFYFALQRPIPTLRIRIIDQLEV